MKHKLAVLVLCAGEGTRMKSDLSKMLHPLCGRQLCLWSIDLSLGCATGEVIAILGHQADAVKHKIEESYPQKVSFALQAQQLGTGDAVKHGLAELADDVDSIMVICGDTPLIRPESLRQLIETKVNESPLIAMFTATASDPSGYGRVIRNENGEIKSVVEHRDLDSTQMAINEINPGVYIFDKKFLVENIEKLNNANNKGEYYLTDLVAMAAKKVGQKNSVLGVAVPFGDMMGINDRAQLALAERELRFRLLEKWMRAGVTCQDPWSTYVDVDVELSPGVKLEPGVILKGQTSIEPNVIVGAGSILQDTKIGEGAQILPFCICDSAQVFAGATIGPFARLRPETKIMEGAKVGNFVEVKKSILKAGAKANHLAYIGDAEIGEKSNIGAGTITCNYDGFSKHKTTLGDGVFIGSNSTLVAPVEIKNQAYVAAGSTISKNVGEDSLAFGRAKQVNKEGYANRIKQRLKNQNKK